MRLRVNISVSPETHARLKQYAKDHHTTVSQAITDWIWSVDWPEKKPKTIEDLRAATIKYTKAVDEYAKTAEKYCAAVDELEEKK